MICAVIYFFFTNHSCPVQVTYNTKAISAINVMLSLLSMSLVLGQLVPLRCGLFFLVAALGCGCPVASVTLGLLCVFVAVVGECRIQTACHRVLINRRRLRTCRGFSKSYTCIVQSYCELQAWR